MKSALGRYNDAQKTSTNSKKPFMSPRKQPTSHTRKPSEPAQIPSEKQKPVSHLWKDFKKSQPTASSTQNHKKSCSIFQHAPKNPFLFPSGHKLLNSGLADSGTTLENVLQQTCAYFNTTNNDSTIPHTSHIRTQSEALAQICLNSVGESLCLKSVPKLNTPKSILNGTTGKKLTKTILSPTLKENSTSKKLFTSPIPSVSESIGIKHDMKHKERKMAINTTNQKQPLMNEYGIAINTTTTNREGSAAKKPVCKVVVADLLTSIKAKPLTAQKAHKRCSSDCMKEPPNPRRLSCGTSSKGEAAATKKQKEGTESKAAHRLEKLLKASPEKKKEVAKYNVTLKKKLGETAKINQTAETSLSGYVNLKGGNMMLKITNRLSDVNNKHKEIRKLGASTPKPANLSNSTDQKFGKRFSSRKKDGHNKGNGKRSLSTHVKVQPLFGNMPKGELENSSKIPVKKLDIAVSLIKKKKEPMSGKLTPSNPIANSGKKTKETPLGFYKYMSKKGAKLPSQTHIADNATKEDITHNAPETTLTSPKGATAVALSVENIGALNNLNESEKLMSYIRTYFEQHREAPPTTIEFYRVGKLLGKGAFGKVNLGMHKLTGKLVALKAVNKEFLGDSVSKKKVMQEFSILKQIRHRHVIQLYETFETERNVIFVIELCVGGDLLTYVRKRRKLKEDAAKFVFRQILEGLCYCHNKGVLHRDIKLDNVLLNGLGEIKICDFGVSKIVQKGERLTEQCGTPTYIAPEILRGKGYEGFGADIWSAGVVLYAILHGTVPFNAVDMKDLHKQVLKGKYKLKDGLSAEAVDLLGKMMELDPTRRITSNQIFSHPWMLKCISDPKPISLFDAEEKHAINKEYAYRDSNEEGDDAGTVFTEQNIDVTQNELTRNDTTKSLILAPFNSIVEDEDRKVIDESDLLDKKKLIKFSPKVKELDRQYEKNNNGEVDNGVYNDCAYSTTNKSNQSSQKHSGLYMDLFNGEDELMAGVVEKSPHANEIKVTNCSSVNDGGSIKSPRIDQEAIEKVVRFGYPKSYVINAVNSHELNHATTTYYLIANSK